MKLLGTTHRVDGHYRKFKPLNGLKYETNGDKTIDWNEMGFFDVQISYYIFRKNVILLYYAQWSKWILLSTKE